MSTNFKYGIKNRGVPVEALSGRFAGMWSGRILFVDYDNGNDGNIGTDPAAAFKTITKAISVAGIDETIYVRPMKTSTNWDTLYGASAPTGTYLENVTVTALTQSGLNIIGTGNGTGVQGMGVQWMGVSGIVSPTIEIDAAFVNVENILFSPMAAQVTVASPVIRMHNVAASGGYAYACSILNCGFEVNTNLEGAIRIASSPGNTVADCTFRNNMVGIYIDSLDNQVDTAYILRNRFLASAVANITANIVTGDIYNIAIEDCNFGTGQPNGTGAKKYIYCAGTATGVVKNCFFGVTGTTMGGINTMSSLVSSGNFGLQGPMQT